MELTRLRGKLYEGDFEVGEEERLKEGPRVPRKPCAGAFEKHESASTVGVERKRGREPKRATAPAFLRTQRDRAQELDGGSHSRDRDVATERWGHLGVGVAHQEPGRRHDHPARRVEQGGISI